MRIATIISLNVNIRRYVCHSIGIRDLIIFNYIKKGGIMKKIVLKLYEFDDFVNNVDRSQLPEGIKFELK